MNSKGTPPEGSKSPRIIAATVLAVSLWQLCLLMLFTFEAQAFLLAAVTGMAIASCSGFLALYFSDKPHRNQGILIVLLLAWYLQIITLPNDRFDARPADEFRAAIGLMLKPDVIQADFLFQRPRAPYAAATAAVHKYQDDLPEHSWYIRFSDAPADSGHLFNIRNEVAASSHPHFRNARIFEGYLVFEVDQFGESVLYRLPLNGEAIPFTAYGVPETGASGHDMYTAEVFPHILSPGQQSRFHTLFFHLLNLRFR
ncbi:MAG: hypothetical protein JJU35_07590 [Balneolales bacterium]|nr:hypothetical protein [Balneolales bacterium]